MEIIAATQNSHKIRELSAIMNAYGFRVISRAEAGIPDFEIEEDGLTFEENSLKKAMTIMNACGRPAIADDSGLETDALSGEPGVYSARYAGVEGKDADAENNRKLLHLMDNVPDKERTARFVSVVTLVFPDGRVLSARGECEGMIGRVGRGSGGFGYDPLFTPSGQNETFAQLSPEVKNRISHRAKALELLKDMLDRELSSCGY
jgi:XTP/dITP diphosphohydrolase